MGWYYEAEGISSSLKGSVRDFDDCSGAGRPPVMARKESVEYPGAIYRTMNRGGRRAAHLQGRCGSATRRRNDGWGLVHASANFRLLIARPKRGGGVIAGLLLGCIAGSENPDR